MKVVSTNKLANFNYFLLKKIEAGIVLTGNEIKSVRGNGIVLNNSFVFFSPKGAILKNAFIKHYGKKNNFSQKEDRDRQLLLHKNEMLRLKQGVTEKGLTVIPTKAYFDKDFLKIEIALARGKKLYNKKRDLKERDIEREQRRSMGV